MGVQGHWQTISADEQRPAQPAQHLLHPPAEQAGLFSV